MPKLKHVYSGSNNIREIDAAAFKRVGVEDQTKVVWSPENDHTAELSDAAAQWLLDHELGDWELVTEDDSTVDDSTSEALTSPESGGEDEGSTEEPTAPSTGGRRPRRP